MTCNNCANKFRTLDTQNWEKIHDIDAGEYQIILRKDKYSNLKGLEIFANVFNEGVHHQELVHEAIFFHKELD
jgi:hypothetical protein